MPLPPLLEFLGATGTVTGSRFLLTSRDARVLVDCGLYQGLRDLRRRNWDPFPTDPAEIDAVVVTHAHLDHTGYLPALVRAGFAGPIVCSPWTAQLARIVLLDAARLQEEDAEHARAGGWSRHADPRPLFDSGDALRATRQLQPVPFGTTAGVAPGVQVVLRPAGHVLGSSTARLTLDEAYAVLFSGDLGRADHPLLRPPAPPDPADAVVVESTYGNRTHPPDDGLAALAGTVRDTVDRGGVLVVPAFAVDRTEVVLMALRRLVAEQRVPDVPVYVDSPMALEALRVYRAALAGGDEEIRSEVLAAAKGSDPFDPGHLVEARSTEESRAIADARPPYVVVSASGMAAGGRVLHHLERLLPDPANTVLLAGFQAEGTRGRALADGAQAVKIHGGYVPVRARVVDLPHLSAHADADGLAGWLAQASEVPNACYVVHGEPAASATLAERVRRELGWVAVVPRYRERVLVRSRASGDVGPARA